MILVLYYAMLVAIDVLVPFFYWRWRESEQRRARNFLLSGRGAYSGSWELSRKLVWLGRSPILLLFVFVDVCAWLLGVRFSLMWMEELTTIETLLLAIVCAFWFVMCHVVHSGWFVWVEQQVERVDQEILTMRGVVDYKLGGADDIC